MADFSDQVVVVTGAGRGIGEAIAQAFAAGGAKVAVLSRTAANAERTAAAINEAHPDSAKAFAVDVADFEAMQAIGKEVIAAFGKVDILVNNAGVTRDGLCLRMKEADWDLVLDTNLKGAFNAVKAFQRPLLKAPAARVINIGSVVGIMGNAGQVNYAASKAGLIGFTKSLAREFASRGLTANVIAPGFVTTDMTGDLSESVQESAKAAIPLGTFGVPDDIAQAAIFLAGSTGRYITGQVLAVDGGMAM
ncbi:3-oxoacyl-[acyl-carrier-protein] reductase [Verrucomicrobiales bacterium]|jgi:3-oxoacyl-[acyl-carrier protein] reductase|nr:3-oxoacyl-[acyl-carrier-protein] reductase [Verrucomicrobiales bacterium]MDB2346787.1 3-oxoacyl-[acyl-carrier-protein] reductase [Verrucomicrobiales bacterium]MDB4589578.1 3-oxoacyl-[acyl-carrier-protein] reductase [Verrucomicrobiales bacterium]MDC0503896.1 3-oxoacyl-[acyl-carrier-protein] reductase [Verrucomicrobiales bacterium]MDF1788380.1 3-oxoacyl-[acyl-carrier-protein] reductase [Verrucomicrobiales bacterium]